MRALFLLVSYFSLSEAVHLLPPKVSLLSPASFLFQKSPIEAQKNATKSPQVPLTGTPQEIFEHYRCQLCLDVTIDNVDLVDGEIVSYSLIIISQLTESQRGGRPLRL